MTAAAIRITLNAQIFSCQEAARRYAEFAETLLQALRLIVRSHARHARHARPLIPCGVSAG